MRISCADLSVWMPASGSCRTTCARSLYADLLCEICLSGCLHQDPVGQFVQDLCMRIFVQDLFFRISAPRSCSRTTCARSLYADLLRKISLSGCRQQDPVGPLAQDPCTRISCALDAHDLAEGCASKSESATLPAFCAIDTHDLRRGLRFEIRKRNFTCILCDGHARSPQRVHISKPCFRSSAPATKS